MRETINNLRHGFTTGACAQAAAKAAAAMLVDQRVINKIDVTLPNGTAHTFSLVNQKYESTYAQCGVIKDAGDDAGDVTNGIEIVARVSRDTLDGIRLTGGHGIGRVTGPGLPVKEGNYAINPVPRKMILRDVDSIVSRSDGYLVAISVPEGEKVSQKTHNPKLGIVGGISIIGTRGIAEPKSLKSYTRSLCVELDVACERGHSTIYLASGYISERVLKEKYGVPELPIITVGDHVGFMLKQCAGKGIKKVVLIGHIGKLVKIAAGILNTHWSSGDARMETIAAYATHNGAGQSLASQILDCKLAEATIPMLRENNLLYTFDDIACEVARRAAGHVNKPIEVAVLLLALSGEIIGAYPANIERGDIWDTFIS